MNKTDWDHYYSRPYKTAAYSRRITGNVLCGLISRYSPVPVDKLLIGELGGANSCFFEKIREEIRPAQYHIIDNNKLGLDAFRKRVYDGDNVFLYNDDVLDMQSSLQLDMVFSVGLIEHFTPEDTRRAVKAHFRILRPGGIAIISFPTPTFLYRITRSLSEILGLWIFHDERPLLRDEVAGTLTEAGTVLFEKIIWPIFLTQRIMVARNTSSQEG